MIRLQRIATIGIRTNHRLINNSACLRISRIDLRIGDEHVVGHSVALPRDSSIGVTRIDVDLRHLVDRLAVLYRQIV